MSDKTILLTGASGSLGAMILEKLIEGGHKVQAVLRSFPRSKSYLEEKYPKAASSGQLTFVEIPDLSTPGVFDALLAKTYIFLHIATPLAYSDFEEKVFKPSEAIINNILTAATKSNTLKRIIITGSIVSTLTLPDELFSGRTISNKDFNGIKREAALESPLHAYQYSKVTAEQQVWKFVEERKPAFDVVFHLSPAITGRAIQQDWRASRQHLGGMSGIYKLFDTEDPPEVIPYFMDMDDVAWMHVKSVDLSVPGNKRYLAAAGKMNTNDLANKIREEYPQFRDRVVARPEGKEPEGLVKLDLKETEEVFGNNWRSWWESSKLSVEDIITTEKKYGPQEA